MSSLTKPRHHHEVALSNAVPARPAPFTCDAYIFRCLLVTLIEETSPYGSNGTFRTRAVDLAGKIALVLVWMRDHKGVPIDLPQALFTAQLQSLCALTRQRRFLVRDGLTSRGSEVAVDDMPEPLVRPVRAYLADLPGYDTGRPYNEQAATQPAELHGCVLSVLTCAWSHDGSVPFWA